MPYPTIPSRLVQTNTRTTEIRPDWRAIDQAVRALDQEGWARRDQPGQLARFNEMRKLSRQQREDDHNRNPNGSPKAIRIPRHDIQEYPADPTTGILFAEDVPSSGHRQTTDAHDDLHWSTDHRINRDSTSRGGQQLWAPRSQAELALEAGMKPCIDQVDAPWRSILFRYYAANESDATIGQTTGVTSQATGKKRRKGLDQLRGIILETYPTANNEELEPPATASWADPWEAQLPRIERPDWLDHPQTPVPRRPIDHIRLEQLDR